MKWRIRILSVVNSLAYGGDEHRMLSFATHIDRQRFDHHIVVIKLPDADVDALYGSLRQEYASARIPLIDLGVKRPVNGVGRNMPRHLSRKAIGFATAINRLTRLVRERDIDIIDGHIGTGNQAAVAVGRLTGRPASVTTYHGEFFSPRPLWHLVQQSTLRGANVIITDSEQRAGAMRTFLRVSGSRCNYSEWYPSRAASTISARSRGGAGDTQRTRMRGYRPNSRNDPSKGMGYAD